MTFVQPTVQIHNPYLDAVDERWQDYGFDDGTAPGHLQGRTVEERCEDTRYALQTRSNLIPVYGFAIPNMHAIRTITKHSPHGIVEVMAGLGYWAWMLRQCDVEVEASDAEPPTHSGENDWFAVGGCWERQRAKCQGPMPQWHNVIKRDAIEHAGSCDPQRTLLMVWPPYDTGEALHVLKAYRGQTFCYVGEGEGGCNGTDEFFEALASEWTEIEDVAIPRWWGIRDRLTVYERNT